MNPLPVLIAINILMPLAAVLIRCGSGRIAIDHVATFTFGYLFYWILPILVGVLGAFQHSSTMSVWYLLFHTVPQTALQWFLLVSLSCYWAYLFGAYLGARVRIVNLARLTDIDFDRRLLRPLLALSLIALAALGFALRDQLFAGYQQLGDPWTPDPGKSALAALASLSIVLLLLDCAAKHRVIRAARSLPALLVGPFLPPFVIASVMLLSMGMRLYVVSGILMLCVYRSVFLRRFSLVNLLAIFAAGLLAAGLVGLWRQGADGHELLAALAGEPLYVALPLLHFLAHYSLPLLRFPHALLSDFVNLAPTILMPSKLQLMLRPESAGYEMFSPGGGLNAFYSLMVNFGIVGTLGVLFVFGFGMSTLKASCGTPLARTVYVMTSGWLAFTFFRDPFYVSIVKCIVEFAVLIPLLITVALHLGTRMPSGPADLPGGHRAAAAGIDSGRA
jgi:hypothetical protein